MLATFELDYEGAKRMAAILRSAPHKLQELYSDIDEPVGRIHQLAELSKHPDLHSTIFHAHKLSVNWQLFGKFLDQGDVYSVPLGTDGFWPDRIPRRFRKKVIRELILPNVPESVTHIGWTRLVFEPSYSQDEINATPQIECSSLLSELWFLLPTSFFRHLGSMRSTVDSDMTTYQSFAKDLMTNDDREMSPVVLLKILKLIHSETFFKCRKYSGPETGVKELLLHWGDEMLLKYRELISQKADDLSALVGVWKRLISIYEQATDRVLKVKVLVIFVEMLRKFRLKLQKQDMEPFKWYTESAEKSLMIPEITQILLSEFRLKDDVIDNFDGYHQLLPIRWRTAEELWDHWLEHAPIAILSHERRLQSRDAPSFATWLFNIVQIGLEEGRGKIFINLEAVQRPFVKGELGVSDGRFSRLLDLYIQRLVRNGSYCPNGDERRYWLTYPTNNAIGDFRHLYKAIPHMLLYGIKLPTGALLSKDTDFTRVSEVQRRLEQGINPHISYGHLRPDCLRSLSKDIMNSLEEILKSFSWKDIHQRLEG
jgi:hypothetical protein